MKQEIACLDDLEDSPFSGRHHARFHAEGVIYHVLSRSFQGTGILRPSPTTNMCIAGVIGRALKLYPSIRIYAHAFMSNHFHLMLSGAPREIPLFVGYMKKEISRRLGVEYDWSNSMWGQPYESTALITHEDQVQCLKYILSQGVKEGLVAKPEQWPGLHSAKSLCGTRTIRGWWLDGTKLAKARYRERRKTPEAASKLNVKNYRVACTWRETRLPQWESLEADTHASKIAALCAEIERNGLENRKGKRPLGPRAVLRASTRKRWRFPKPPFYQLRRRMICWAQNYGSQVRAYLRAYWAFQNEYRSSAVAFLNGAVETAFPPNAHVPGRFAAA